MKYKVTYMATDFSQKDLNGHRSFNKDSFIKYLNNPKTIDDIEGKKLMGAISHFYRDKYQEYIKNHDKVSVGNQSDFLLSQNAACNAITDMEIRDNKLYITIETLPTEQGLLLAKLYDDDYNLPVSMSTELSINMDNEYCIEKVFGLDITCAPAFKTYISKKERLGE